LKSVPGVSAFPHSTQKVLPSGFAAPHSPQNFSLARSTPTRRMMRFAASRIAARSTSAGTPVKSCITTARV
jgi:hypothetical protein